MRHNGAWVTMAMSVTVMIFIIMITITAMVAMQFHPHEFRSAQRPAMAGSRVHPLRAGR